MAASFRLMGISNASMRLWQVLLALATIALAYLSARAVGLGQEEGLLAALMLATALQFFYQTTVPQQDMPLTFFLTLAMYGVLRYLHAGALRWALLSATGTALAVLTKGIAGLALFCAVVLATLIVARPSLPRPARQVLVHAAWATLLFAVVAVPWFVVGALRQGHEFVATFLTTGTLGAGRFFRPAISTPPPYMVSLFAYVPILLLGTLPWMAILLLCVADLPRILRSAATGLKAVAVWFLTIFVVLSLSSGDKVFRYLLPVYPAAAILMARTAAGLFDQRRRLRRAGEIGLAPAVALIAGGFWFLWSQFPPERDLLAAVVLPVVVTVAAGLAAFSVAAFLGRGRLSVALAAAAALTGYLLFNITMVIHAPAIDPWPELAAATAPLTRASDRLVLYGRAAVGYNFARFHFHEPVSSVDTPEALAALWTRQHVLVVVPDERYDELARILSPAPVSVYRSPAHLTVVANWTETPR
jgi:4-amino-4-deoxy-L-arabinose transferase-like glycosyltransferase